MRRKTLSMQLVSAMLVSAALPAGAQVALELSSQKTYRQDKKDVAFKGGNFNINFRDGSVTSVTGCNWFQYYPAAYFKGVCAEGTTAFITSGNVDGVTTTLPYLLVTSVYPAIAVQPRNQDSVKLVAAPASKLPRPEGGFKDASVALYYNLHTTNVREYVLTRYATSRKYAASERARFEAEIVPGAYHYSFPRLNNPAQPAPITAVIYPMAEGSAKLNHQEQGVKFTSVGTNSWTDQGFMELSYRRPNEVKWKGFSPTVVFPGVDSLYISLKELQNYKSANSPVAAGNLSIFPAYSAPSDARVKLTSPYLTSYTLPPTLHSGTRALLTLDLQRNIQTGGVTYDFSSRKFEIPVMVIDRYTEYADTVFGKTSVNILEDTDKDGYNNLTEWILDSNSKSAGSIPTPPEPVLVQEYYDPFFGALGRSYFGFTIDKKLGTIPRVKYTLQRSQDGGRSWQKFVSDANWDVNEVQFVASGSPRSEIRVRSKIAQTTTLPITYIQPPGTEGDRYRVKVVLAKVAQ